MSQFVLPIIGNGEADLQKHMLLFNLCFDLMILVFVYWLINNFELKIVLKLSALALVVFFVTLLIQPTINNEETGILKTGQ